MNTKHSMPHNDTNAAANRPVPLTEVSLGRARLDSWEPGESIFGYTDHIQGIYYVMEGEAHLTRLLEQGFRKTLHVVRPGHFFFEGLYFWPEQRVLAVHAHTAARTAFFDRAVVPELVENDPAFRMALYQSLAAKAINTGYEVVEMAYSDSRSRMLHVLRELVRLYGKAGTPAVEVAISQGELAERMGLHPVSVNRTLRRLESEGCVKTGRQRITIYPQQLGDIAAF